MSRATYLNSPTRYNVENVQNGEVWGGRGGRGGGSGSAGVDLRGSRDVDEGTHTFQAFSCKHASLCVHCVRVCFAACVCVRVCMCTQVYICMYAHLHVDTGVDAHGNSHSTRAHGCT